MKPEVLPPVAGDQPADEPDRSTRKQKLFAVLRDQGYGVVEAASLAGFKPSAARSYGYRLEQRRQRGLLRPLVPLAKKSIKTILQGKPVGNALPPRSADVLRAAELVLEREDPAVQRVDQRNLTVTMALTSEERERYMKVLGLMHD